MGRLHTWTLGVGALSLLLSEAAVAATTHEAEPQAVRFVHEREAFDAWSFDTGWLPPIDPKAVTRPPIQVRFIGHVGGGVEAYAEGDVHFGWQPWQLWASAEPEGGLLSMNLGVELAVSMRVDITLPDGSPFLWEGPMPGNEGFDYRFAAEQTFTPFLLDGAQADQTLVSDTIQKTRLFEIPITPGIVPIPGVSGSLDVDAGGVLDVILKKGRLTFSEGILAQAGSPLMVPPHDRTTHETQVRFAATALYAALLELVPQVNLHLGPLEYTLAAFPVPIPLDPLEEQWEFEGGQAQSVSFGLPKTEVSADGVPVGSAIGFDGSTMKAVVIRNAGFAPLTATLSVSGEGFSMSGAAEVTLAPGASTERILTVTPAATPRTGLLSIASNDPAGGESIALSSAAVPPEEEPAVTDGGNVDTEEPEDPPRGDELLGGCAAAPGPLMLFGALSLLALRRRRR